MNLNYPIRFRLLGLLLTSLYFFGSLTCQAWRSELYPETWTPPESASFYTDKLIQDFSYAGYQRGEVALPNATGPVIDAVAAHGADPSGTSDSTAAIQAAIDAAVVAGGGVVFLPAGTYLVEPSGSNDFALRIQDSNVVLRGAGIGQTYLQNSSYDMRSKAVIRIAPPSKSYGSLVAISTDLEGPKRRIPVADTTAFSVGDLVRLQWDFTPDWVTDHNQEAWWGAPNNAPSSALYLREITTVNTGEGWIEVDIPTRYTMKTRDNPQISTISGLLSNVGIEDLSIGNVQHPGSDWAESDYTDNTKSAYDTHASWLIKMEDCYDSWITDVESFQASGNSTGCHMLSNGILLLRSFRVTMADCAMRRSQYGGGGGNGYMFRIQSSQDNLIQDCTADFSRHGFVISHQGTSGNVFLRCEDRDTQRSTGNTGSYTTNGSGSDNHMLFSHSNLWDQCHAYNSFYAASHRGNSGSTTKHGLSSAHAVYWNTSGSGTRYNTIVESEQGRYGYVIGTSGTKSGASNPTGGNTSPADHLEGIGSGVSMEPQSLYADQLTKRLQGLLVDAGEDATVAVTATHPLNPSVYNYGSGPAIYTWSQVSGPTATLDDATSLATTVALPSSGTYVLELTAQDGAKSASDQVTLTVVEAILEPLTSTAPLASVDMIVGRSQDTNINPTGYFTSSSNSTVGATGSNGSRPDLNVVYRYALPTLPIGETITEFSISFQITAIRDHSNSDYELDVYLLDSTDPTTTGTDLFYHGADDADHALIGSHFEASGSDTSSITLTPPVDVTLTVDSGPTLELLQSFYTGNQPNQAEVALRFNLDQLYPVLDSSSLNRYILNNSAASDLDISSLPGTFVDWSASFDLGGQAQPGDDPDADGIANIIEAWFGTHPGEVTAGLTIPNTDGTVTTFTHPKNPRTPTDLSGSYKWSPNLMDWYASSEGPAGGPTVSITASTTDGTTTVTATSSEVMEQLFLLIEVTQN